MPRQDMSNHPNAQELPTTGVEVYRLDDDPGERFAALSHRDSDREITLSSLELARVWAVTELALRRDLRDDRPADANVDAALVEDGLFAVEIGDSGFNYNQGVHAARDLLLWARLAADPLESTAVFVDSSSEGAIHRPDDENPHEAGCVNLDDANRRC